jgi:hypothetical protein
MTINFSDPIHRGLREQSADLTMTVPGEELIARAERRQQRRRLASTGAGVLAAAVAAVGVSIGLPSTSAPAFAVATQSDGDIVVTIHDLNDAAGFEQALRDRGVDVDVDSATNAQNCAEPKSLLGGTEGSRIDPGDVHRGPAGAGQGSTPPLVDPPGEIPTEPPATLTQDGEDWTLRIPAESLLKQVHFLLTRHPNGDLDVAWQLSGGTHRVIAQYCQMR